MEKLRAENQQLIAKAGEYDLLISNKGWAEAAAVMSEKVNAEITEATHCPLEPEKQRVHVIRWNAMRELLDAVLNDIKATRASRDELTKEQDERDEYPH